MPYGIAIVELLFDEMAISEEQTRLWRGTAQRDEPIMSYLPKYYAGRDIPWVLS